MKTKKALISAVAGAGALALAAAVSLPIAQADPPVGEYRALAGGGSDTTQDVMEALSDEIVLDGQKVVANYLAIGSATISTKAKAECQNLTRPNGSSAGRDALQTALQANSDCFQWARSSSSRGTYTSPVSMAWVPFGTDALTVAVRSDGDVPRDLTKAQIEAIFKCEVPAIQPALPQVGSGSRNSWLDYVGIPRNFDPSQYPCLVPRADGGTFPGNLPQEHDGTELAKNQIMPYSAAVYQAQMFGTSPDRRGKSVILAISGTPPTVLNTSFDGLRSVFNVIPSEKADDPTSLEYRVFVGTGSEVCKRKSTINLYGFGDLRNPADCGSTTSRS